MRSWGVSAGSVDAGDGAASTRAVKNNFGAGAASTPGLPSASRRSVARVSWRRARPPAALPPAPAAAPSAPIATSRRWLGAAIALLALIAIGALAWYLTHRPPAAAGRFAGAPASGASGASGAVGPVAGG